MRSASRPATDHSGFARGFRLSSELVAGVLVGSGIGWLIDKGLGTLPWGMFVFAMLGFAAGVWNVMRQAGITSGGVPNSTIERRDELGAATAHRGRRDDRVWADPIHQFQINKIFTIGHDRRARDRIHELVAVHGDRGRDHRRRC